MLWQVPLDLAGVDVDSLLQPAIDTLQPFLAKLSLIFGGIFGLYVLLIVIRVYYERKKVKLLQNIRYDLDHLNMYYGVSHSQEKKGVLRKVVSYLRKESRQKNKEKQVKDQNKEEKKS